MKLIAALAGLAALIALPVSAATFVEGEHYQRIGTPVSVPSDRVEVIEAFAYPCPACRNFHPIIARWESEAPDHVAFSRLPVGLQRGWDLFARAYYTAQVLGLGEDAHEAVFKALHDERRQIRNFEDIAGIYTEFGVDAQTFISTAESFAVESQMGRNRSTIGRLGVRSTPTMIVQGKWRVTPNGFESYQAMMEVVDYLVAREVEALGLDEANGEDHEDNAEAASE